MKKPQVGNRILSLNVSNMPERGGIEGVVTKIETDARNGVEYVYFTADKGGEFRVPQNGTESAFSGIMNNIQVLA